MTPLPNVHTSPETAYLVEDYPYGFRLRCQIRYWLETNKKGTRFMSQTTNPKRMAPEGPVWNKPKASTYSDSGALYLDENGHVQWDSVTLAYTEIPKLREYLAKYPDCTNRKDVAHFLRMKEIFEEELAKFTPRPEYGSALHKLAYGATIHRMREERKVAGA